VPAVAEVRHARHQLNNERRQIRAHLGPERAAGRKNPAKIGVTRAEIGGNWRFSEGPEAPFFRVQSRRADSQPLAPQRLASIRTGSRELAPERHFVIERHF
jgi:hypothetical protein